MRLSFSQILSPLICLAILAGVYGETLRRVQPANVEPFHAQAKAEIQAIPYQLSGWVGSDSNIPPAAMKLLHPNVMLSRMYVNPAQMGQWCGLLVEECRDSRDMLGHYPPICYPAHGMTQLSAQKRDWRIDGIPIHGMEYRFSSNDGGQTHVVPVYNFMIVPGIGCERDMDALRKAAKDYQRRYFGAAQIQLTFPPNLSQQQQDAIFSDLMSPNSNMLRDLIAGGQYK
ncbi:MAG TPA: exosortase-associated EpsI family protein [Tepidisphaeraceae bacterium]|jgi:hypothetical protein